MVETVKIIDMLTEESVSIITQKFYVDGEEKQQIGENHRKAYFNNEASRADLEESEPENIVNAIYQIWGSSAVNLSIEEA